MFERFSIWEYEEYRQIQGTYPVISLSFANIKEDSFSTTKEKICRLIQTLFMDCEYLLDSEALSSDEKEIMIRMKKGMNDAEATLALHYLSKFLNKHHGKKAIILLDEYDTPMQEAYVNGYWEQLVAFTRSLFNSTFKTNPYMSRAIMTGITRVSKESVFSDLNNLKVVTTTSNEYATDVFKFNWHFENSYDDKKGVATCRLIKIYKPSGVIYEYEYVLSNGSTAQFSGYMQGTMKF